jgi:hypothetical protein
MESNGGLSPKAMQELQSDRNLDTNEKVAVEGDNLINGFTGILKEDADFQKKVIEKYFDYSDPRGDDQLSINIERGAAKYIVNTGGVNRFRLTRIEGSLKELLEVNMATFDDERWNIRLPSIKYSAFKLQFGQQDQEEISIRDSELTVKKGKELLAKTQKDFTAVAPPAK